jgi:hypothetical protein
LYIGIDVTDRGIDFVQLLIEPLRNVTLLFRGHVSVCVTVCSGACFGENFFHLDNSGSLQVLEDLPPVDDLWGVRRDDLCWEGCLDSVVDGVDRQIAEFGA